MHEAHLHQVEGDPPEGKTTAVVAVMRGNQKHGYHRHRSNKHDKKQIVRVLLDSGSDGDLVFVSKDKPMLLPKGLHRWFDQLNLEKLDRAEVRSKYTDCTHKK